MNESKLSCAVVGDLLALYHDGVVHEQTAQEIRLHLQECENCRREYEALCDPLPAAEQAGTKASFFSFLRREKRRKFFAVAVLLAVCCGLLIGAGVFIHQIPIVDVSNRDPYILRCWQYEWEGQQKLFVLYESCAYTGYSQVKQSGDFHEGTGESTITLRQRTTLLSKKYEDHTWMEALCLGLETANGLADRVYFGEKLLWQKGQETEDVPAYVYAYEEYERSGEMQMITSLEEGWIGFIYADGSQIKWDYDGKILYMKSCPDAAQ